MKNSIEKLKDDYNILRNNLTDTETDYFLLKLKHYQFVNEQKQKEYKNSIGLSILFYFLLLMFFIGAILLSVRFDPSGLLALIIVLLYFTIMSMILFVYYYDKTEMLKKAKKEGVLYDELFK